MGVFMDSTCIPYTRVPHSSALYLNYLYHYDRVAPFYDGSPFELSSYQALAGALNFPRDTRRALADVLASQNRGEDSSAATLANIDRLVEPGTFAVVTGQQVGLFSGPAFTIYKALTAVFLAENLTQRGVTSVPIFWLATEDHDLEEVAETATLDEEYELIPLRDAGVRPAPRSSVGRIKLSEGITSTLERLENKLPAGEARDRLLSDLRASYQPGAFWGQAFGRFVGKLFKRWGVILLDPLHDDVHGLAAKVYEQAIARAPELRQKLAARSEELVRAGFHAQVHVTEDSTLVFANREGNRLPLHERGGEFLLDGREKVPSSELVGWIRNQPLDFSPNVLLRPVVQDTLLPTVAYVAGPSELAYLAQAQVLYESLGRPLPVVYPRAGFTLVNRQIQRLLEKYRLTLEDVWQEKEHLNRKIAAAGFSEGWAERLKQSQSDLAALLERLRGDIETLDPTLLDFLRHAEDKMRYQMERLEGKISRAALDRSELLARHEKALLRFLAPRRNLQEREVSGVYFLGRAGYELLDKLLSQIEVDSPDHRILVY